MKKLSIITVCYNIKDEIEKTCKSIVNQTWQDFEWIVVDGGSADGTLDVLNKYRNRIDILISEPDSGIYNAMNKGIRLAKGEWINFMNGGDYFVDKEVLKNVFLTKEYSSDILYGPCLILKDGKIQKVDYPSKLKRAYFSEKTFNHQSSFIKKELFDKYGLYDEQYKVLADWKKWITFIDHSCLFEHLDFPIAFYDINGISSHVDNFERDLHRIRLEHFYSVQTQSVFLWGIPLLKVEIEKGEGKSTPLKN